MKSPFPPKKCDDTDDWMLTYADMVTLLLTFFILLASISKIDANKFEKVKAGFKKGISNVEVAQPLDDLKKELRNILSQSNAEAISNLTTDSDGVVLELASSLFYGAGDATVHEEAKPILKKLATSLLGPLYTGFQIEVQGHTDTTPISTAQFPSNWELSSARATGVIRQFIENGMPPNRMKAVGMADIAPKAPNHDIKGNPLPENQEVNRRIAIRIYRR